MTSLKKSFPNPISFELNLSWKWMFSGKDMCNEGTPSHLWSNQCLLPISLVPPLQIDPCLSLNILSPFALCYQFTIYPAPWRSVAKWHKCLFSQLLSFAPATSWCRGKRDTDFTQANFRWRMPFSRTGAFCHPEGSPTVSLKWLVRLFRICLLLAVLPH